MKYYYTRTLIFSRGIFSTRKYLLTKTEYADAYLIIYIENWTILVHSFLLEIRTNLRFESLS